MEETPDQLAEAMKGTALIEAGMGWVKIHGIEDPAALVEMLAVACPDARIA